MDVYFPLNGITFIWNEQKARANPIKHDGITFPQSAEAFSIASGLSLLAKRLDRSANTMKPDALKKRLKRDRPMTTVTIRMPEDAIKDLKRIAPILGFSGYQPLARTYIGLGLRTDMERLENDILSPFVDSLKRRGVSDDVIQAALNEVVKGY